MSPLTISLKAIRRLVDQVLVGRHKNCVGVFPPKMTKHRAREPLKARGGRRAEREIALSYAVDHSTISRLARHVAEV